MGDENTASNLVLAAAILQTIFSVFNLGMGGILVLVLLPLMMDPLIWGMIGFSLLLTFCVTIGFGIFGLVLAILWFYWRTDPSAYRIALIITGVISLIISFFIPGTLAIVGGAIVQAKPAFTPHKPAQFSPPHSIQFCPTCGARVTDSDAQYCWSCGAAL